MSKLNINSFNRILLAAAPDVESKIEILRAELEMVNGLLIHKMGELLDELDANGYESEKFQEIRNIKENTVSIFSMLEELEEKEKSCDSCVLQHTDACSALGDLEETCEDFLKEGE